MKKRLTLSQVKASVDAHIAKADPILDLVSKDISAIKAGIDELRTTIGWVTIKDGEGREVSFSREDFFQMIYDRPKNAFNRAASFSEKAFVILRFTAYGGAIVYFVTHVFKVT